MTATEITVGPLSKVDVAAIRKADDLHAHTDANGVSWISCTKRRSFAERDRDPFLEDQVYRIYVAAGFTDYGPQPSGPLTAFSSIGITLGPLVRVGDRIRIVWLRANCNELQKKAGFANDECWLELVRAGDEFGRRPIRLLANTSCIPAHSLARMVRDGWTS